MKILIDARLYGLENAGLGRYIINLVSELSKEDTKNEYALLLRKKYFDSLDLPKNWKKVLADFRHYSFTEQMKLPGLIKNENPDIVHFPHFNIPIFYRGKFIVTIHDMLMHDFAGLSASTLPGPVYFLKQLVYRFVFGRAVNASAGIIVPSNAVRDELAKYYKVDASKIKTVYEGFDSSIQDNAVRKHGNELNADMSSFLGGRHEKIGMSPSEKIENPYFVYAGNAYPHKNLNRLIEAVVMLNKESDKKTMLLIASARNVFVGRLEKVIEKLKAQDFVKLLGFVPDSELGSLLKNSLGFVAPALSEGFGLPGLEAINSGTLLLASDIQVFKEVYGNHAIYFNPFDFSSIEKAMQNVIEMDPETRKERIEEAKEFSKRYSWAKMAKETLAIYRSTVV